MKFKKRTLANFFHGIFAVTIITFFATQLNVFSGLMEDSVMMLGPDSGAFWGIGSSVDVKYSNIYESMVMAFFVIGIVLYTTRFIIDNVSKRETSKEVNFTIKYSSYIFMGLAILILFFTGVFTYSFAPHIFTAEYDLVGPVVVKLTTKYSWFFEFMIWLMLILMFVYPIFITLQYFGHLNIYKKDRSEYTRFYSLLTVIIAISLQVMGTFGVRTFGIGNDWFIGMSKENPLYHNEGLVAKWPTYVMLGGSLFFLFAVMVMPIVNKYKPNWIDFFLVNKRSNYTWANKMLAMNIVFYFIVWFIDYSMVSRLWPIETNIFIHRAGSAYSQAMFYISVFGMGIVTGITQWVLIRRAKKRS